MPVITIREQEDVTFATFDATENTVLVPMVYIKDKEKDVVPEPVEYKNATVFKNEWLDHCSWLEWSKTSEGEIILINDGGTGVRDRSYFMVYELLLQGLNVLVVPINKYIDVDNDIKDIIVEKNDEGEPTAKIAIIDEEKQCKYLNDLYGTKDFLDTIKDRNIYNIKFITSGAYENIESRAYVNMTQLASDRGDAVALLEYPIDISAKEIINRTDFSAVDKKYKFAAVTYPWCIFSTTADMTVEGYVPYLSMPASFTYLMAYANSVKTNANWFAAAGTMRGRVPNLISPKVEIGEALMHTLQNDELGDGNPNNRPNINPIYNAGTYGYRIWGNRVAWVKTKTEANQYMEYLNVRILLCDIKKQIYHAAMRITFEPNDDIVWYNFKSLTNSLLDKMKSGRGIKWYRWVKEEKIDKKATIVARLTIQPIEAVESIDVNVILTDQNAEFEEEE